MNQIQIDELIISSSEKMLEWSIAVDNYNRFSDAGKTLDECKALLNYYEGRYDAFLIARNVINKS